MAVRIEGDRGRRGGTHDCEQDNQHRERPVSVAYGVQGKNGLGIPRIVEQANRTGSRLNTIEGKHKGLEREHNLLTREHRVHHGGDET